MNFVGGVTECAPRFGVSRPFVPYRNCISAECGLSIKAAVGGPRQRADLFGEAAVSDADHLARTCRPRFRTDTIAAADVERQKVVHHPRQRTDRAISFRRIGAGFRARKLGGTLDRGGNRDEDETNRRKERRP